VRKRVHWSIADSTTQILSSVLVAFGLKWRVQD
jgi:hypothetical protein